MTTLYTLQEVSTKNGKNGAPVWVVIKDKVYDFTNYLNDHPGGGELITEWAGKDGTKAFDEFGHSGDATSMMKPFKIGDLVEADKRANRDKKSWPTTNGDAKSETPEKYQDKSCLAKILCGMC